MTARHLGWSLGLILIVATSSAQRVVREWGGANPASWLYDPGLNTIEIIAADTNTFSFETYDLSNGNPLDIDAITVVAGVGGVIKVQVAPQPGSGRGFGARSIRTIDLSNAGNGKLMGLVLQGSLGRLDIFDTGYTLVDSVAGPLNIGESLVGIFSTTLVGAPVEFKRLFSDSAFIADQAVAPIFIDEHIYPGAELNVGGSANAITIGGQLLGSLDVGSAQSINLLTTVIDGHSGNIDIRNNFSGILSCSGPFAGTIHLHADFSGLIDTGFRDLGNLIIDGDLNGGNTYPWIGHRAADESCD